MERPRDRLAERMVEADLEAKDSKAVEANLVKHSEVVAKASEVVEADLKEPVEGVPGVLENQKLQQHRVVGQLLL